MAFILHWVDHCSGIEEVTRLSLSVGTLLITRQEGVISKMDWDVNAPAANANAPSALEWLDPHATITLRLLKQGSAYRQQVWAELCQIPYGTTLTYAALAKKINSAARAVGNACRDNPYPLLIPCHRVVSATGMGGYCGQTAGDFMTIKTKLLALEAAQSSGIDLHSL
ncbi:MAG: methylated-DNA--[protein]-cysteine S-methyltransferase [Methylococcaceae bacterium]